MKTKVMTRREEILRDALGKASDEIWRAYNVPWSILTDDEYEISVEQLFEKHNDIKEALKQADAVNGIE